MKSIKLITAGSLLLLLTAGWIFYVDYANTSEEASLNVELKNTVKQISFKISRYTDSISNSLIYDRDIAPLDIIVQEKLLIVGKDVERVKMIDAGLSFTEIALISSKRARPVYLPIKNEVIFAKKILGGTILTKAPALNLFSFSAGEGIYIEVKQSNLIIGSTGRLVDGLLPHPIAGTQWIIYTGYTRLSTQDLLLEGVNLFILMGLTLIWSVLIVFTVIAFIKKKTLVEIKEGVVKKVKPIDVSKIVDGGKKIEEVVVSEEARKTGLSNDLYGNISDVALLSSEYQLAIDNIASQGRIVLGSMNCPELRQSFVNGLLSRGTDILDAGEVPASALYFISAKQKVGSILMLTRDVNSNPCFWFKVSGRRQSTRNLSKRVERKNEEGRLTAVSSLAPLFSIIKKDVLVSSDFVTLIACQSNTGDIAVDLINSIGGKAEKIDCLPALVTPTGLNEKTALELLENKGGDLLIWISSGGTRMHAIHSLNLKSPLSLIIEDVLDYSPGSDIVLSSKIGETSSLIKMIVAAGGNPVIVKKGQEGLASIKQSAVFVANEFGAISIKDRWSGLPDGVYGSARLCEIISDKI